jgi:hypothetical protein
MDVMMERIIAKDSFPFVMPVQTMADTIVVETALEIMTPVNIRKSFEKNSLPMAYPRSGMRIKLLARQKNMDLKSLMEDKNEEKSCRIPMTNMAPKISGFVKGLIEFPRIENCNPKIRTKSIAPKNQFLTKKSRNITSPLFATALAFVFIQTILF